MKWLSAWRKYKGLTQTQLSNKSGIDANMISRYERKAAIPSLETIKRLALGLEISIEELLNGPASQNWELRLVVSKEGVIDMTGATSTATLNIGDTAMGITLSAGYELWEDDAKFEELINQIRRKRQLGLRTRREGWE